MNDILFFIKQSFLIICQNTRLIFPSFLVLLLVLHFSFYSLINISEILNSKSISTSINAQSQSNFLRYLSQFHSSNDENKNIDFSSLNLLEAVNSNITELAIYYEFVQNITMHGYYGKWENFNIDKNIFVDKEGEIELNIRKKSSENYLFNLNQKNNSNLSVTFILKDGEYIDNYIVGNFSFNFKNVSLISNLNQNNFSIILQNVSMAYAYDLL